MASRSWLGLIAGALSASLVACGAEHAEPNASREHVILVATVTDPARAPVPNAAMQIMLINTIADIDVTIRGCAGHAVSPQTAMTNGRGEAVGRFELLGPFMVPLCAVVITNPPGASGLSADTLVQNLGFTWTGKDSVGVGIQLKRR